MNRRGFFRLLAGASVVALAPSLLSRPHYSEGQTFSFKPAAHNTGPVTLQIDGGPIHPLRWVMYGSNDEKSWHRLGESDWGENISASVAGSYRYNRLSFFI